MKNTFFMRRDRKAMKSIIKRSWRQQLFSSSPAFFLAFCGGRKFLFRSVSCSDRSSLVRRFVWYLSGNWWWPTFFAASLINFLSSPADCAKHFSFEWIRDCFLPNPLLFILKTIRLDFRPFFNFQAFKSTNIVCFHFGTSPYVILEKSRFFAPTTINSALVNP